MIKLYTAKNLLQSRFPVCSKKRLSENDIEGYFCTVEELRELFEAVKLSIQAYPTGHNFADFSCDFDFDQWLASKEKAE